jgi:uncharacterized membrane protein
MIDESRYVTTGGSRQCPGCGAINPFDAVFCGHAGCHKALGEFRYAAEEAVARSSFIERVADHVNGFVGKPHFITIHVLWFAAWIVLNSGLIMAVRVFDSYPFGLLGIILSVEAILITGFLLISNQRQNYRAEVRSELDYEVNVRSYRKLSEIETRLDRLLERLERLESRPRG